MGEEARRELTQAPLVVLLKERRVAACIADSVTAGFRAVALCGPPRSLEMDETGATNSGRKMANSPANVCASGEIME